ncbi:Arginine decarboxylase 1 [Trichinella patagoniensis]|uniref:Arginine decarboxylase 1 n=1 Tax=Trichinella patagoniensis TaxID=990121 RepID=A0A0V0YSX3_9BILA|nr:Arginine decarboxylase 1 [Trichinella patagoniensis]
MPGPSCADVLRSMQHEPELMFESLKRRAEEYAHSDGETIACGLARAFNSMPYLVLTADEVMAGEADGVASAGSSDDDDVEWELMRCLSF